MALGLRLKLNSIFLLPIFCFLLFGACKKPQGDETETKLSCERDFLIEPATYNSDSVTVYCPNIMRPDEVGAVVNEGFYFFTTGITGIDYSIYQNGKIIFHGQDINTGWDGKYEGVAVQGKFQYLAVANTIHNETINIKGSFICLPTSSKIYNCQECRFSDQIIPGRGFVNPTVETFTCGD